MNLHSIQPAPGAKKVGKRLGRGTGSGVGKTCGRGVKGQKARSGGYHKVGFEGGQMPLQRRLPKVGFTVLKSLDRAEVRLGELAKLSGQIVTLDTLKQANVIRGDKKFVKLILSGEVSQAYTVKGIKIGVTKGARAAIEAAGGKIED
jgi:large subunit ribosomal protein L15